MTNQIWKWKEGKVDSEEEHIKLGYGGFNEVHWGYYPKGYKGE
ncbi:hypothetical protein ACFLQZ_03195 [Acidobacteriota bacterium]